MKKQTLFKDIPCVVHQAYFIMIGIEGSWLWEATYPQCEDEAWCKNFVKEFIGAHGDTIQDGDYISRANAVVQEMIDDSYEDILAIQLRKTLEKAVK